MTNGTVEVATDGALGNVVNMVNLSSNSLAEGLRIAGTFDTSRTINLEDASSGIDVTGGNTFITLNTAFTTTTSTNNLRKNDLGTLVLTQAQTDWDGVLTIGQGVSMYYNREVLGTTTGRGYPGQRRRIPRTRWQRRSDHRGGRHPHRLDEQLLQQRHQ
ncbi:MAG: hypothetical protein R3F13_09105 [Prosthecobacter sp.]